MKMKVLFAILCIFLVAAGTAQAGGDAANGEALSSDMDCAACHGDDGKGDDETPAIAGLDAATIAADLQGYKSGEKEDESGMMVDYAVDLSDQDIADLAAYYAGLK